MEKKSILIRDKKDLSLFAEQLKKFFKQSQVLLLDGPLGVGKTTFVRFLLETLEKERGGFAQKKEREQVTSPAFTIQNNYHTSFGLIQHIDLYRLKDDEDLESTGFWDIFSEQEKKYLIIIEWANRLNPDCLPLGWNYIRVVFSFGKSGNTRNAKMESFFI